MSYSMRSFLFALAVVSGLVLQPQAAQAGLSEQEPVVVQSTYYYAYGTIDATRSEAGNQYLGCGIQYYGSSTPSVFCAASDGTHYLSCYTSTASPAMVAGASSINTTSYIFFQTNSTGQCTSIEVENDSYNL